MKLESPHLRSHRTL